MTSETLEEFPTPRGLQLPPAHALMSLLSRVQSIAAPWSRFAKALMTDGYLDPDLRELVVLRVAARRGCRYIESAHLLVAEHAGLDSVRIAHAAGTPDLQAPSRLDAALLQATDELLDQGRISPGTRESLGAFIDERALVELPILVGQYALVGMLCETFGLAPEPPASGVFPGDRP